MSRIQAYLPPVSAEGLPRAELHKGVSATTPFVVPSIDAKPINAAAPAPTPKSDAVNGIVDALSAARTEEKAAADLANRFAAGDPSVGIHEAMIASEKASISVRFAVTLKNRAVEAYKEILNTPV